jgi:hypothetical protein
MVSCRSESSTRTVTRRSLSEDVERITLLSSDAASDHPTVRNAQRRDADCEYRPEMYYFHVNASYYIFRNSRWTGSLGANPFVCTLRRLVEILIMEVG